MPNQNHVSDHDLQLVVSEQQTETPHEQIETHVADCQQCQDRLLEFAADDSWRSSFCISIGELSEQSAFENTDTRFFNGERDTANDDFELHTIDQMLEDVLQPPTHPETLGRLGRYEVEKVIGFGGMGIVLRGFDRELHRPVAIKMIAPRLSRNGTAKERFLREAKAAGALLHPNVIGIHDISESNDVPWFVMPLVVGPTLQEVVEKNGPLPTKEVVRIGKQIAAGLAAAHQQGLVHRDIKPANILVDNQINRIVITDFGLARREAEESMTQTGMLAGTLNYMSPEQSRGEDVDARSDLFSLGSLLFFLSTGVTPFQSSAPMGIIHKVGNEPHSNAQALNPDVPAQLAKMIDRLLEKSPSDRFQSANDLEEWLASYLAHLNQPAQTQMPVLPVKPTKRTSQGAALKLAAGTILATALIGGIFYAGTLFATKASPQPIPNVIWPEIQQRYQLSDQESLDRDLQDLTMRTQQLRELELDQWTPAMTPNFKNSYDQNLEQLERSMNSFSQQLNDR
jgi:serine/threonine-protein kinase